MKPSNHARDGIVLAACVAVIAIAAGSGTKTASPPPAAPSPSLGHAEPPPPLPPGAELPSPSEEMSDAASCHFPDRGFGDYERFRPLPLGRALIPTGHGVDGDGSFDLLIHFHGAEAVRKMLAPEPLDLVIVGVDAGVGSSRYAKAFANAQSFDALLNSIEKEVARTAGVPTAKARHIALSSWSAGYGAVGQILLHEGAVDRPLPLSALILLDSLYASYAPSENRIVGAALTPFVQQGERAARGDFLFFLTYTEIPTYGYASTSETAAYLVDQLGLHQNAVTVDESGANALVLRHVTEQGRLFVQGYAGMRKEDHCAQLKLLPRIMAEHVLPTFLRTKPR